MIKEVLDGADGAGGTDGEGSDEALVGLFMNEAIGMGAIVPFDPAHFQVFVDPVEPKIGAGTGGVGVVGNGPEGIGSGHQGADAGFRAGRGGIGGDADIGEGLGLKRRAAQ